MDIKSLKSLKFDNIKKLYNIFIPTLLYANSSEFYTYIVQKGEEMRIDLVGLSIYDNNSDILENLDVLLYINNIDNAINISEGMSIVYPLDISVLDSFRIYLSDKSSLGNDITKKLSAPKTVNKTTKSDTNREKFIEQGYVLPPVVLEKSTPPVRLEDNKIIIGGIN